MTAEEVQMCAPVNELGIVGNVQQDYLARRQNAAAEEACRFGLLCMLFRKD